ncbi:MAG: hypothetical protein U0795_12440 [Pirellulales bacterium]
MLKVTNNANHGTALPGYWPLTAQPQPFAGPAILRILAELSFHFRAKAARATILSDSRR